MKKVALGLVLLAAIGLAVTVVLPGVSRIRRYEKAFSRPGALAVLTLSPVRVDLPQNAGEPNISLGYARFRLDPEAIRSIERRGNDKSVVQIEVESAWFLFMSPSANTPLKLDEPVARAFPNAPVSQYDLMLRVARAAPKTWLELFLMPEGRFQVYLAEAVGKSATPRNEQGIGLFENDEIAGIIHFGEAARPGSLNAEVFSRRGDIAQGILLKAETTEEGLKRLQEILGSFSFTMERVPEGREDIGKLIFDALRGHPKLRE